MTQLTIHEINEERRLQEIEHTIKNLDEKVDALTRDLSDLVTAWKAASFLLSVVKGLGAIALAVGSVMLLLKGGK